MVVIEYHHIPYVFQLSPIRKMEDSLTLSHIPPSMNQVHAIIDLDLGLYGNGQTCDLI